MTLFLVVLVWLGRASGEPALDPCAIEGVARIVAVGDVHGAYGAFVGILRKARVIDGRARGGPIEHLVAH